LSKIDQFSKFFHWYILEFDEIPTKPGGARSAGPRTGAGRIDTGDSAPLGDRKFSNSRCSSPNRCMF